MALRQQRPGRVAIIIVVAVGVVVAAFAGCGSSRGGSQTSARESEGSAGPTAQRSRQEPTGTKIEQEAAEQGSNGSTGSHKPGMHKPGGSGNSNQHRSGNNSHKTAIGEGRPQCPRGATRTECKTRIEAQKGVTQGTGKPVSTPSDCTKAMSEAQCREILGAQKAAADESGKSVSPETCLKEYSREFCEERFGQQAAAQAGK